MTDDLKDHLFQGYTALTDKIYLLEPPDQVRLPALSTSAADPTTVLLFTWGNAHPKHVLKYASGYRTLYPHSRQIIVLCTLLESMLSSIDARMHAVLPVLDAAFRPTPTSADPPRILAHVMSNSGAVSFLATALAHRSLRDADAPIPHTLLVADSVPGGSVMWRELGRWSRALALATASVTWFPLPVWAGQAAWTVVLLVGRAAVTVGGYTVGIVMHEGLYDTALAGTDGRRLYMYSEADEMVGWRDVEAHIAVARERGYMCSTEKFHDSPHVGHAKMYPERYWSAVARAWTEAVSVGRSQQPADGEAEMRNHAVVE